MTIEVKEEAKVPRPSAEAQARLAQAQKAGFTSIGCITVKIFGPTMMLAYLSADKTAVLAIIGGRFEGKFVSTAVDLVSKLESGETVTTTTFIGFDPQPERGIFKYAAREKSSVAKLLELHRENLAKHKFKPVAQSGLLSDLARFVQEFVSNELRGLPYRHWLQPPLPPVDGQRESAGPEGSYVSKISNNIRIAMENGRYAWGGTMIHDSGTYRILSKTDSECVIAFDSVLGGTKKVEITREGKKYLFTEVPERFDPEVFTRPDGAEFLVDRKLKPAATKPTLAEGSASGELVPVDEIVDEFEKGFVQNVRKEIIPRLVAEGILTGKTIKKKGFVKDDEKFRAVMRFGIENFATDSQEWSFVAVKAPFNAVADRLRERPGVSHYKEKVSPGTMKKNATAPVAEDMRHVFLVSFAQSQDWVILLQTIHWLTEHDITSAMRLAEDLSKRLKCKAIAVFDTDVAGSAAMVYTNGKKNAELSTEEDFAEFYALFYKEGLYLPEAFIAEDGRGSRLLLEDPRAATRVDAAQIRIAGSE